MSVHADHTVLPSNPALNSRLDDLSAALEGDTELAITTAEGRSFVLSSELRDVLVHACRALSHGHAVTVKSIQTLLSTQEAADLLGVSRPTVVKLLAAGEIEFTQPGRHRRIRLKDVLRYQERVRSRRRDELAAMAAEAASDDAYGRVDGFTETR